MLPDRVLAAIARGPLPTYVYDLAVVRERVGQALSLLDCCYYPIKSCPVEAVVRAAMEAGSGLDLCSLGDTNIANAVGCPGSRWSFTSAHAPRDLLRGLLRMGSVFDADSEEQMREWRALGGIECGLRVAPDDDSSPYGVKFGVPARGVGRLAMRSREDGLIVVGLHMHESNASRMPADLAVRIEAILAGVDNAVLRDCRYVNIGGGWPIREGWPVGSEEIGVALDLLRNRLAARGFAGMLVGEPGEWVVGPAGYWAATVSAVKRHPHDLGRRVIVLDTATPVPCKPSAAPFVLVRDGLVVGNDLADTPHDVFGSANTGSDAIGLGVLLPDARPGDLVVSLCQGAYTRSLTGSFNERPLPGVTVV
jgi:diaminopimelate decarboxylase